MGKYISTFITGFDKIVEKCLLRDLEGAHVIKIYDGLIYYYYNGDYQKINKLIYLNNTFYVMESFKNPTSFKQMIFRISKRKYKPIICKGTFRIRFSKANQFAKVEKKYTQLAEKQIIYNSKLRLDRLNSKSEIWYIIRSEKIGFYCQLIHKRENTEKNLNKGQLRPEFAYLMCECANLKKDSIVCDPFCGYASIPKQLLSNFRVNKIFVNDLDKHMIDRLKQNKKMIISNLDACNLSHIKDSTIDAVITDPPWGYYEQIEDIKGFYINIFKEMVRIVKNDGTLVLLSARKEEFMETLNNFDLLLVNKIDTLVNGKKASVFVIKNNKFEQKKTLEKK